MIRATYDGAFPAVRISPDAVFEAHPPILAGCKVARPKMTFLVGEETFGVAHVNPCSNLTGREKRGDIEGLLAHLNTSSGLELRGACLPDQFVIDVVEHNPQPVIAANKLRASGHASRHEIIAARICDAANRPTNFGRNRGGAVFEKRHVRRNAQFELHLNFSCEGQNATTQRLVQQGIAA